MNVVVNYVYVVKAICKYVCVSILVVCIFLTGDEYCV
jgi:hypothetical protein